MSSPDVSSYGPSDELCQGCYRWVRVTYTAIVNEILLEELYKADGGPVAKDDVFALMPGVRSASFEQGVHYLKKAGYIVYNKQERTFRLAKYGYLWLKATGHDMTAIKKRIGPKKVALCESL